MGTYFEMLVQNAQKGEMYNVKLKSEPMVYLAIPMIPGRYQNEAPPKFILNIVSPKEFKGVSEHLVEDIEFLERNS
jgi:hypothetical protein